MSEDSQRPSYIYLRPFVVPFLKVISQKFNIILYTYMKPSVFEQIFEGLERIFGEDFFSALICFPRKTKAGAKEVVERRIEDFLSAEENRTIDN